MSIVSTNPDSGSAVAGGSKITIVSDSPYLTTIVLRRDGWDDETVYSGSTFESGYTGTRAVSGGEETLVFRRDDGWTESPFQLVTDDGTTETTLNFTVEGAADFPAFMGVGGGWSRRIYLNNLLDVNVPLPNDTEVLGYDAATGKWIAQAASTPGAHVLNSHSDVNTAGVTDGQALVYDQGSNTWIPGAGGGGGTGDVTAALDIADNRIVRGDGGSKGVQESPVSVSDTGSLSGVENISLSGTVGGVNMTSVSTHIGITAGNPHGNALAILSDVNPSGVTDESILEYDLGGAEWVIGNAVPRQFVDLTDVSGAYAGNAGYLPRVNNAEDGLELVSAAVVQGSQEVAASFRRTA